MGKGRNGEGKEGSVKEEEGSGEQGVMGGSKPQGWEFMLGDIAKKKRKPLKGSRKLKPKKSDLKRVNKRKEKQGFVASWLKAAKSKAASKQD